MIEQLRGRLDEAEAELARLDSEIAQLEARRAVLRGYISDARAALRSYDTLRAGVRAGLTTPVEVTVDTLVEFLRQQTEGVVTAEQLTDVLGIRPAKLAELARRRAAQGRFAYDTAVGLVKLL